MKWNEAKKLLDEGKAIRHRDWESTKKWKRNKEGILICLTPYSASNVFIRHFICADELKWARRCSKWEVVNEN